MPLTHVVHVKDIVVNSLSYQEYYLSDGGCNMSNINNLRVQIILWGYSHIKVGLT